MTVIEFVHELFQQGGAHAAWSAKSAAFMGKEMHEISRHLEHVAALVENHERTGGRQVLECDPAVELSSRNTDTGRAADLHRLRIDRAARLQHLAYAYPEWILIQARTGTISGNAQDLGTGRGAGAYCCVPGAALLRDQAGGGEGFDVVYHRRLVKIAVGDGKRRTISRRAALALERFVQCRLFAEYIGAGAQVDFDIEDESRLTQYA